MDNEPSKDIPPPKLPWKDWQWLMLFSPGLLMVVGALDGMHPSGDYGIPTSGVYTGPIVILICLFLATKLTLHIGKSNVFANLLIWLLCFSGLVAANLAIGFAGCAMLMKSSGPAPPWTTIPP